MNVGSKVWENLRKRIPEERLELLIRTCHERTEDLQQYMDHLHVKVALKTNLTVTKTYGLTKSIGDDTCAIHDEVYGMHTKVDSIQIQMQQQDQRIQATAGILAVLVDQLKNQLKHAKCMWTAKTLNAKG